MDYHKEKLEKELIELKDIFNSLYKDWKEDNEDYENLYKIRVNLFIVASLMRLRNPKEFTVEAFTEIKASDDSRKLIFTAGEIEKLNNKSFENKIKKSLSLEDICNYLIHEEGSHFTDNKNSTNTNFSIYYVVHTDERPEIFFDINIFIKNVEKYLKKK